MNPHIIEVPSTKNIIQPASGFKKKDLADNKVDLMALCWFGCRYCSSNQGYYLRMNWEKGDNFKKLAEEQLGRPVTKKELSTLTFEWPDVITKLQNQLHDLPHDYGKDKVLVFTQLTDGFSPRLVDGGVTKQALDLLLKHTSFRIRVLTKNAIVGEPEWVDYFLTNKDRFTVGLSTGTLDDSWSKKFELGTSPPSERLAALNNLQEAGVSTFGMLCPVFPDLLFNNQVDELIEKINPTKTEYVWAEPYNERDNWQNVQACYRKGSEIHAWFDKAFSNRVTDEWSSYATDLYKKLAAHAEQNGWLDKLKYLLYETNLTDEDAKKLDLKPEILFQSIDKKGKSKNIEIKQRQSGELIPFDPNVKQEIDQLSQSVITAKEQFQDAWITLALKINELKSKINEVGNRTIVWNAYTGYDSFEDYCENELNFSYKTCYQMLDSLRFIEKYKPELLEEYHQKRRIQIPSYTKIRSVSAAIKKLSKGRRDTASSQDKLLEKLFDDNANINEINELVSEYVGDGKPVDLELEKLHKYLSNTKTALVQAILKKDYQATRLWINGLNELAHGDDSTTVENPDIKRIIVTKAARKNEYAKEVIKRATASNPGIDIVYLGNKELLDEDDHKLMFPSQMNGAAKFWYSQESLVLRERGPSTFIETFPSPGSIVENLGTMLKLGFHCRSVCEYCYLQGGRYPWQELFTNLDKVKAELAVENYVHKSLLSIWSAYTFYLEKSMMKVPPSFDKMGKQLRIAYQKRGINSEKAAVEYLQANLAHLLGKLHVDIDEKKLVPIVKDVPKYYKENKKLKINFNIGEYADIIAMEPLSHHMEFVFKEIVDKYDDFTISIWTKSVNFDEILKHDGQNKVLFTIGLNTNHIIDKYESGTASLDERIDGIIKLQKRGGYKIRLNIEPLMKYDDCENEYADLIKYVMDKIDSSKIVGLNIGGTRYRTDMVWKIRRNHPWSDILDGMKEFEEYDLEDKRLRYSEDFRVTVYKKLIEEFKNYSDAPITLAAEIPEMWDWIGLDRNEYMKKQVYQYPG